eukprot:4286224-Alexandrium_andersonii.AAC.1
MERKQNVLADARRLYEFRRLGGVFPIHGVFRFLDKSRSTWTSEAERPMVDPMAVVGALSADEILD